MKATHAAASAVRHTFGALLEALLLVAIVAALVFGLAALSGKSPLGASSVFAAKGGHHATQQSDPGCSVAPNPVPVGDQYTVSGWGVPTTAYLNVWIEDSHGVTVLLPPVNADGTFSGSSWASWAGTSNVTVKDISSNRAVVLATCSFEVN